MATLDKRMASAKDWLEGARLRTLPAAAAPVLVGGGAAFNLDAFSIGKSLLALGVALALQVGVNLANDYSDGVRGTDRDRVGPTRLTASGLVPARQVLVYALSTFGVAGVLGLTLIAWSGHWWMLAVGLACVGAAWFYTGGRRPYGYMGVGLSELFVFVFFGLVATVGTTYVQTTNLPWWVWCAASGIGLISVALLMVNNIRDIPTDSQVGKNTLAVRLGDGASRVAYMVMIVGGLLLGAVALAGVGNTYWWLIAAALLLAGLPGAVTIAKGAKGLALLGSLRNTGLYALAYGVLVGAGLALSSAI